MKAARKGVALVRKGGNPALLTGSRRPQPEIHGYMRGINSDFMKSNTEVIDILLKIVVDWFPMPPTVTVPKLTPKQRRILDYVRNFSAREGGAPSLEEIRQHVGCRSLNNIRQHLRLIEKKGCLSLRGGRARGIRLTEPPSQQVGKSDPHKVPLVGQVAAGRPILAEENIEAHLPLPGCFQPAERFFALRIDGESMVGIGILSGDVAIVEKCEQVDEGAVAAVRIGDAATLKRVCRMGGKLVLRAENPDVKDLVVPRETVEDVRIEGRLAGVLRCYLPGRKIF
jgi:repressor LexA